MKSLIKTYALPLLVLFIGGGLYYVMLSKSVQSRLGTETKSESTAALDPSTKEALESSPPSISSQGEIYTTEQDTLHLSNTPQGEKPSIDPSTEQGAPQELDPLDSTPPSDGALAASDGSSAIDSSAGSIEPEPTPSEPEPKLEAIYYSKATSLNIRAIPKTSGRIVGRLTLGQSVVVVEIENEWARLDSGGWVSLALLSPTEPSERLYVVIPNTLNIRQSPESGAPVVGALYKGQKVQVQTTQDEWARLDSGGWVSLRLIKAL